MDIIDHTAEVLGEFNADKAAALEAIGIVAEAYAKMKTPVDTGRLRNSISHAVSGDDVYIGTNVQPYAIFVELGTGIYASDGQGRKTPWAYYDRNGKLHYTRGIKPHHMLKKAATEHTEEYKRILSGKFK
ncbi:MAG: HK97 gp10 family phage protein [Bacteroidaceae bacterium]|nr:HK97 gp10 family phage protein [Bacteroidaceae bacterium]